MLSLRVLCETFSTVLVRAGISLSFCIQFEFCKFNAVHWSVRTNSMRWSRMSFRMLAIAPTLKPVRLFFSLFNDMNFCFVEIVVGYALSALISVIRVLNRTADANGNTLLKLCLFDWFKILVLFVVMSHVARSCSPLLGLLYKFVENNFKFVLFFFSRLLFSR